MKTIKNFPRSRATGQYQENQHALTRLKVVHKLAVKPYSYQSLWTETRIQRNKLREILDSFVETSAVISHKYIWKTDYSGTNDVCTAKTGLKYYILDLDSKESLYYLKDINLNTYAKDFYRYVKVVLSNIENFKRNGASQKDLQSLISHATKGPVNEIYQIVKNMDHSFSPLLYTPEDERRDYNKQFLEHSFIEEFKKDNPQYFSPFREFLDNSKFLYDVDSEFQQFFDQMEYRMTVRNVLKVCKKYDLSKYDVLIHLSHLYPTRENYLFLWSAIKEY